jgi:hypothetical protein
MKKIYIKIIVQRQDEIAVDFACRLQKICHLITDFDNFHKIDIQITSASDCI